jgi:hypothetical protein
VLRCAPYIIAHEKLIKKKKNQKKNSRFARAAWEITVTTAGGGIITVPADFTPCNELGRGDDIILGIPFLQHLAAVHDGEAGRIGFAVPTADSAEIRGSGPLTGSSGGAAVVFPVAPACPSGCFLPTIRLAIGTPPAAVAAVLDTGSADLFVFVAGGDGVASRVAVAAALIALLLAVGAALAIWGKRGSVGKGEMFIVVDPAAAARPRP